MATTSSCVLLLSLFLALGCILSLFVVVIGASTLAFLLSFLHFLCLRSLRCQILIHRCLMVLLLLLLFIIIVVQDASLKRNRLVQLIQNTIDQAIKRCPDKA